MSGQEMIVAIVALSIFGGIATTFIRSVYKIINKKLDNANSLPELDKKFYDDYITFKQEVRAEIAAIKNQSAKKVQSEKTFENAKPLLDSVEIQVDDIAPSPRLKNMLDQKK
ncbi:MAG: hypothetical protein GW823_07195 [Bacteroidetes bacterium]|nr:hypothetical protein [Bacteroidota bacterium]